MRCESLYPALLATLPFMSSCISDVQANPEEAVVERAPNFEVRRGEITDNRREIHLSGVNWSGFETVDHVAHGLWARPPREIAAQIKSLGFTAVRLPFCPTTLEDVPTKTVNLKLNPDLAGKKSMGVLDTIIADLEAQGLYYILDHHSPNCRDISELWYTRSYSEKRWIKDLRFVAARYEGNQYFVGIDLKNEPYGAASWGTGNSATDWDRAVERAGNAVLAVNQGIIIFVEGIQTDVAGDSKLGHWWGGNLEPLAKRRPNIDSRHIYYLPHVYGPSLHRQEYFNDATFPRNMPAIWETQFGRFVGTEYGVGLGEFGGSYEQQDRAWQVALVDWMIQKRMCNFFYWGLGPNSDHVGGLLQDDWRTVNSGKYANLKRLLDICRISEKL